MKFTMRGPLRDLIAFGKHLSERNRVFAGASAESLGRGSMNELADRLHPRNGQPMAITAVREEAPDVFTYRLEPPAGARVAPFRAGQYVAVETAVSGNRISRPYSIATPPEDAIAGNYYEITVKRKPDGYLAADGIDEWVVGTEVRCSEPEGFFTYEPLRDSTALVCLAGGTGITPFRAIIPDVLGNHPNTQVWLLYGINTPADELYGAEFRSLVAENPDRFRYVLAVVDGGAPVSALETSSVVAVPGFITAKLIDEYTAGATDPSFFICGPEAMQDHLTAELAPRSLPRRRIRRENFGTTDGGMAPSGEGELVAAEDGKPVAADAGTVGGSPRGEPVSLRVISDDGATVIPARRDETVLVALERAGLNPPARCRSGECGWCRSKLVSGVVHVSDRNDGRRSADKKFSYVHTCVSYPITDLTIKVVANPLRTGKRSESDEAGS